MTPETTPGSDFDKLCRQNRDRARMGSAPPRFRSLLVVGAAAILTSVGVDLVCLEAHAQSDIDWGLANVPIAGNGMYMGPIGTTTWKLTVANTVDTVAQVGDTKLLKGRIQDSATATYTLKFDSFVLFRWQNDAFGAAVGGLVDNEYVQILDGVARVYLADNSANIPPVPGAGSYSPVITTVNGGVDWHASWNSAGDHAYYRATSIGLQDSITWTHTSENAKFEAWRVPVWAGDVIDWASVFGNGSFSSSAGGVAWEMNVSGADSVGPQAGDSTLLRGAIGGSGTTATYTLVFAEPVYVVFENDAFGGSVGGLAGLDFLSNEFVDLVGAASTFELEDNSANVVATPGASSVSPVFSTVGSDLRAESSPGVDHAYYRAHSLSPTTTLTWTHNNAVSKAEVWRIRLIPQPAVSQSVPALGTNGLIVMFAVLFAAALRSVVARRLPVDSR